MNYSRKSQLFSTKFFKEEVHTYYESFYTFYYVTNINIYIIR
jgi:hypothetical protein